MSCAVVDIVNPQGDVTKKEATAGLKGYPDMLVANISNGCTTPHTDVEVQFPDPRRVVELGDGEYPLALPQGNCNGLGNMLGPDSECPTTTTVLQTSMKVKSATTSMKVNNTTTMSPVEVTVPS